MLLTSREQPRVLTRLQAETSPVHSLAIGGLGAAVGGELLVARGLVGLDSSTAALVERYSGNPLALGLIAEAIHEVFGGDIDAFLAEAAPIFDDIRDVLDQQFARLTPPERDLLLWLAVAREPLSEAALL